MKRVIPVALVAFIAALSLALSAAQPEPAPTYLALKTTARQPSLDGTVVTLTLASGAWAKFRAIDIDYDRTAAYANTVVVKAETAITSADKKSLTLTFSRGFVATVWAADVDYDVMRSGFAAYHDRLGEAHPSKTATADDAAVSEKCAKDWPDDFRMRDYCQGKQRAAIAAIHARSMTTADERTIRGKCEKDWPTDFTMRDYCEDQQLKALARIKS
jgi:hypothetical protein